MHAHRSLPDNSDRVYRWLRLFRGQESELPQLRHWLTELLPDGPGRDDLISVAVELGTNAVQHTASGNGGWFTVEVASLGPMLRVSVTDEGAERGPSLTDAPPTGLELDLDLAEDSDLAEGSSLGEDSVLGEGSSLGEDSVLDVIAGARCDRGRGLVIVRALAVACGVCGNASGRTVWAEVVQAPAQPESPARPETKAQARPETEAQAQPGTQAQTPARIHTRTPSLSLSGPANGSSGTPSGQGRSSRPSASSAMAISRTL
ncbi:MAG TPA: ATP-binding protein [Streptosporangiaceae bacterium]